MNEFIMPAMLLIIIMGGFLAHDLSIEHCPICHSEKTMHIFHSDTSDSYNCQSCGATWKTKGSTVEVKQ